MNPLSLIPARYRLLGEAVIVALLVGAAAWALMAYGSRRHAAGDVAGYQRGHAEAVAVKQAWDAEKIRLQQHALEAEQRRRHDEAATAAKQQEALDAQVQRAAQLAAQLDLLRREHGSLQQRASAFASIALGGLRKDDPASAGQRQAVEALRDSVGECSQAYGELAAAADVDRSAGLACEQSYDALTASRPF